MKKLLLLLLLSLAFIGQSFAGDVYLCKHEFKEMGAFGYRDSKNPPDITLIVERKKVTNLTKFGTDTHKRVFKIKMKYDNSLNAMSEASSGIQTLHFNKKNGSFYMASVGPLGVSSNAGVCTFMYSQ
jgi:hypothetical protein